MSRRNSSVKRKIENDAVYGDYAVAKFINMLMIDGKKTVAEKALYGSFDIIKERLNQNPLEIFKKALNNISPAVEVKSRRVGGATYQVPIEVAEDRGIALAMRWLIDAARKRGEQGILLRLAGEIIDASGEGEGSESSGRGGAIKKREEVHRMAEANKAFSHFRW